VTGGRLPSVMVGVAEIREWRWRIDALRTWLDDGELARLDAFRNEEVAERFVVSHALLRSMLGARLDRAPQDVRFARDRDGRPRPADRGAASWRCSLSHAGGLAVAAIAEAVDVGIDVEPIDPRRADLAVAARYLSPTEVTAIVGSRPSDRPSAIALGWTRLEAEAKGRGIALDTLRERERTGFPHDLDVGPAHVATLWTPVPVTVVRTDRPLLASVA
jgi:phosphopantetheinyl transferase